MLPARNCLYDVGWDMKLLPGDVMWLDNERFNPMVLAQQCVLRRGFVGRQVCAAGKPGVRVWGVVSWGIWLS